MDHSLLVAHEHMAYALLGMQRIVNRQYGAAGIAEYRIDPKRGQRVEQGFGASDGGLSAALLQAAPGHLAGQDGHARILRRGMQKRHRYSAIMRSMAE